MNLTRLLPFILATIMAVAASGAATAQSAGDYAQMRFIDGWKMADGRTVLGLEISLAPGWKTYWRMPGSAGIPPQFDWTGSENVAAIDINWPLPVVFDQAGLTSVGYKDRVVLPLILTPAAPGAMRLAGTIQIGVCDEICIPLESRFDHAVRAQEADRNAGLVASLASAPLRAEALGLPQATCEVSPISDGLAVSMDFAGLAGKGLRHVVVEAGDPAIWVSDPVVDDTGGMAHLSTEFVPPDARPFALARESVRTTFFYDGKVVEFDGCRAAS